MSLVSSLAFPGSKTLAGWWRQLAIHQPRAFGVGYLFVHRIEAPVWIEKARRIEPLVHLLLQAVQRQARDAGDSLTSIDAHLHLGRQILFQILLSLAADGLTTRDGRGRWSLTAKGNQALAHGDYPAETSERRTFHFVERLDAAEQRVLPPHFVNLRNGHGQAWTASDSCRFDVNLVRASIEQPLTWKQRFDFPSEVRRLVEDAGNHIDETAGEAHTWKNVIVDRLERFLTAWTLVAGQDEHSCLVLYPARQDGWSLNSTETLFRSAEWSELFPALNAAPDMEELKKAWLHWANSRGLPDSEARACELSFAGHRLHVQAGPTIVERLKKAKSDVFKGETWLLIGDGALRTAVLLEVLSENLETVVPRPGN